MTPGRRVVSVVGELLLTAGVLVLAFLAWQLWWTDVVAEREQAAAVTRIERDLALHPGTPPTGAAGSAAEPALPGGALALLRIPRFGADWVRPVYEGTTADVLDAGVGHYVTSAAPGEVGNLALAGHRVTYGRPFNRIAELRAGDRVEVRTRAGTYVYLVRSHEVVSPDESSVIAPVPGRPGARPTQRWLTLTSCHPEYSAAERYVVHALLLSGPGVG